MKLQYLQKFIWNNLFLLGIRVSISMQNLKTLRFFKLAKVSPNKVSFAKINIFCNNRHAHPSIERVLLISCDILSHLLALEVYF